MNSANLHIDRSWTLFLDRDGVINRRITGGYVKTPEEFELLPGVGGAIAELGQLFGRIVVVSNQQGIGRGLMTEADLARVHRKMTQEVESLGGRIDAIFYSPHLEADRSFMRKPGVGMGLAARRRFPEIRFRRCLMAGDTLSDMIFGRRLGMVTTLITQTPETARRHAARVDLWFPCLPALAAFIRTKTLF